MAIQDDLLGLVDAFNEAALEPGLWQRALARLGKAVGGSSTVVMSAYDPSGGPQLIESVGYNAEYWDRVQAEHSTPETNRYINLINNASPGQVLMPRTMMPLNDWLDDPIYLKFLRPDGLSDGLMCPLKREAGGFAAIAIFRNHHYAPEHAQFLEAVAPYIRHALDVHLKLNKQAQIAAISRSALDHFRTAVVLTDRHGRMITANQAALNLLKLTDGISAGRGGMLLARKVEETIRLQDLIATASGYSVRRVKRVNGFDGGETTGGSIRLSRPSGLHSLEVLVTSFRAPGSYGTSVDGDRPSAIVFLSDPEEETDIDVLSLRRMYGFTAAESRLVLRLVGGVDLAEAARGIGVTMNTARTLLKRSFDRTQTNRQSQLISKILRGPLSQAARVKE